MTREEFMGLPQSDQQQLTHYVQQHLKSLKGG